MSQTKAQLLDGKSSSIEFSTGSASSPTVSFTGDTNTGIYSPGADQVAVSTNGTGRLFVDASGNIGTTATPGALLDLAANNTGLTSPLTAKNRLRFTDTDSTQTNNQPTGTIEWYTSDTDSPGVHAYISTNMFNSGTGSLVVGTGSGGSATQKLYINSAGTLGITADAAAPPLIASIGGSEVMRLDSSGRLGLGTSAPAELLHVNGNIKYGNTGYVTDGDLGFIYSGTNNGTYGTVIGTKPGTTYSTARNLTVSLNPASGAGREVFRIAGQSGNVGIGTQTPGYPLEVATGTLSGGLLRLRNTNASSIQTFNVVIDANSNTNFTNGSGATGFIFNSGATEYGRWDSSGRLLVGTSSWSVGATAAFVGNSSSSTGNADVHLSRGLAATGLSSGQDISVISFSDNAGEKFAQIGAQVDGTPGSSDYPGRLVFSTTADGASSPTQRMTIKSNGDTTIACGTYSTVNSATTNSNIEVLRLQTNASNSSNNKIIQILASGGQGRGIVYSGNSASQAPFFAAASDRRLKTNIREYTEGYEKIKAIPVKLYDEIDGKKNIAGWIADEVQQVIPSAINGAPNAVDSEGSPIYQSLGATNFIPDMVQALQAAIAKIEALEAKVAALEGN